MKPRTAKREHLNLLEGLELEELAAVALDGLERAYAAIAIIDDRALGPAQHKACLVGAHLEIDLKVVESILANLEAGNTRDTAKKIH